MTFDMVLYYPKKFEYHQKYNYHNIRKVQFNEKIKISYLVIACNVHD